MTKTRIPTLIYNLQSLWLSFSRGFHPSPLCPPHMQPWSRQAAPNPLRAPLCPGDRGQLAWHGMGAPSWSGPPPHHPTATGVLELRSTSRMPHACSCPALCQACQSSQHWSPTEILEVLQSSAGLTSPRTLCIPLLLLPHFHKAAIVTIIVIVCLHNEL